MVSVSFCGGLSFVLRRFFPAPLPFLFFSVVVLYCIVFKQACAKKRKNVFGVVDARECAGSVDLANARNLPAKLLRRNSSTLFLANATWGRWSGPLVFFVAQMCEVVRCLYVNFAASPFTSPSLFFSVVTHWLRSVFFLFAGPQLSPLCDARGIAFFVHSCDTRCVVTS